MAKLLSYGWDRKHLFLVLQYIDGVCMTDYVHIHGPFPAEPHRHVSFIMLLPTHTGKVFVHAEGKKILTKLT